MDENAQEAQATITTTETTTVAPTVDMSQPAGVPHGTVLDTENGQEKVVHDLDDQGNVIGWHKEVV